MTDGLNQSLAKGLRILEALLEGNFEAKTVVEIAAKTGLPHTTAWRMLKTLEAAGWVVEIPTASAAGHRWEVNADPLARIAHRYQERALKQVHAIKRRYHEVTGKELNA